jgi:hypothetical protein
VAAIADFLGRPVELFSVKAFIVSATYPAWSGALKRGATAAAP